jgi:hypothetical protein
VPFGRFVSFNGYIYDKPLKHAGILESLCEINPELAEKACHRGHGYCQHVVLP